MGNVFIIGNEEDVVSDVDPTRAGRPTEVSDVGFNTSGVRAGKSIEVADGEFGLASSSGLRSSAGGKEGGAGVEA